MERERERECVYKMTNNFVQLYLKGLFPIPISSKVHHNIARSLGTVIDLG